MFVLWFMYLKSQQTEVFYKKGALTNFAKFTGKHLLFNKVAR